MTGAPSGGLTGNWLSVGTVVNNSWQCYRAQTHTHALGNAMHHTHKHTHLLGNAITHNNTDVNIPHMLTRLQTHTHNNMQTHTQCLTEGL